MLDKSESESESDIENLLEDSETKYIADKEESYQLLTTKATIYVEGEVLDINETPVKTLKKKVAELKWKRTSKFVIAKKCILEATSNVSLDIL